MNDKDEQINQFKNHLENASEVVRSWPVWKQEVLGGAAVQPTKNGELSEDAKEQTIREKSQEGKGVEMSNEKRFQVVSDLPEWTVWDNEKKRDLFPTRSGNRSYSCKICNEDTALLIANALNYYFENHQSEMPKNETKICKVCPKHCNISDLKVTGENKLECKDFTAMGDMMLEQTIESLKEKSAIEILLDEVTKEKDKLKKQLTDARRYGNLEANKASRFERQVEVLLGRLSYMSDKLYGGCAYCPAQTRDCDVKCVETLRKWSLAKVKEECNQGDNDE